MKKNNETTWENVALMLIFGAIILLISVGLMSVGLSVE